MSLLQYPGKPALRHRAASYDAGGSVGLTISSGIVTLTATSLGSRLLQTSKYYDNYESRTVGSADTAIGLTDLQSNGNPRPVVANDRSHSGSKALKMTYPIGPYLSAGVFPTSGINTSDGSDTIYIAVWAYWTRTTGTGGPGTFKWCRGGASSPYSGTPRFYETINANGDTGVQTGVNAGFVTPASGTTYDNQWRDNPILVSKTGGSWHFVEYYYKLSTPGSNNGAYKSWVDGQASIGATSTWWTDYDHTTTPGHTNDSGSTATIQWIMSPFDGMDSYGVINSFDFWLDEMLLDVSAARIVLTNNATYSSSTKFAIQPITSWSSTVATATYNPSTFTSSETVYAHVWLSDNTKLGTVYTASAP